MSHPTRSPTQARRSTRSTRTDAPAGTDAPSAESLGDAAHEVPERPALAPGVELSGEMEDSAFEDPPWMVLRGEAFIRLTELLYRVVENADGRRSIGEIAEAVSEATGRAVSEDNIRTLVRDRLIPLGLIERADGTVTEVADDDASRSPLQIGMRTAQIPGRILEPFARAFTVLFVPPILLVVVAAGMVALAWVFLLHGVGEGLRTAAYEPWLILVLFPIVIGSAAFHEFGHAAALTYGGGRVRGMGAGVYTVYPVFFTDVTENYRLKRWARVRTDLGGFHFNLVFAIAIVGLYLATGLEFLLLAAIAIALSIVQQSIPIVRLDGYWALVDMTGIPDPLSYIKPFLKSIVPVPAWRDERVPRIKTWAKVVLLVWMAIAIPVMLVLGVFMLATAPRVIGTTVDSFYRQAATLSEGAARGDLVTVLSALVSIALLVLTSVAFAWFIAKTVRGILRRAWNWAGKNDRRRAAAAAGTVAMVGVLAFLWAPPLPFIGTQPGPFHDFSPIAAGERLTVAQAVGLDPSPSRASSPGVGTPAGGPAPAEPPGGPAATGPAPVAVPPVEEPPVVVPAVEVPAVEEPAVEEPAVEEPPVEVPSVAVPSPGSLLPDVPDVPIPGP